MTQKTRLALLSAMAILIVMASGCETERKSTAEALRLIEQAHKSKDYDRMMSVADSLVNEGDLMPSTADYWRGYACDRLKRKSDAAMYWQAAIDKAANFTDAENVDIYVKAAGRLANQLSLSGDYEGTLKMAMPVTERAEELKCDTTSDYINLLIYIGLCQVSTGYSEEDTQIGLYRACEKHRENIERRHSDEAYKDAIAGLVNIAYYCVNAKQYEPALYYTRNFAELLIEYEQRSGVDAVYIDRQVGRFSIYKTVALDRLGRKEEAAEAYKTFLGTQFCKSAEGKSLENAYLQNLKL